MAHQNVFPQIFCERQLSICVFRYRTWLIIDWYSCRLKACSPLSRMAAVALAPKNGPITLATFQFLFAAAADDMLHCSLGSWADMDSKLGQTVHPNSDLYQPS